MSSVATQPSSDLSLAELYNDAVETFQELENTDKLPKSYEYRVLHSTCLDKLALCAMRIDKLNLYASDDSISDIPTGELRFLNLNYLIAVVVEKTPIDVARTTHIARLTILKLAVKKYLEFAKLLSELGMDETGMFTEQLDRCFPEGPLGPFVIDIHHTPDYRLKNATQRNLAANKKRLQRILETSSQTMRNSADDESTVREIELLRLRVSLCTAWMSVQSIIDELQLLCSLSQENAEYVKSKTMMVPTAYLNKQTIDDLVNNNIASPTFQSFKAKLDDRVREEKRTVDNSTSVDFNNPQRLLGPGGKVMKSFMITNRNAADVLRNVQGTGQRLPTISIDQLVEKELANSLKSDIYKDLKRANGEEDEESDSDSDEKIMEKRRWDEFTEENPRGSGNTMNRG